MIFEQVQHFIFRSFLIVIILSGLTCQKEQMGTIDIHPKFQIYVDRFVQEAAQRGHLIDFSDTGLKIEFRNAVDVETGGVCRGNHHIEIEKFYWEDLTDADKEGLIFHELGHCELNRRHRNDTLPNGEWSSRMRGSPIPEELSAVINYSGVRREYYIDELFDEATPVPDWATYAPAYGEIANRQREQIFFTDSTFTNFRKNFILDKEDDFEIELEVDIYQSLSYVGIQFGGSIFESSFRIVYTGYGKIIIDSGKNLYGTMRDISNSPVIKSGFNKLTLRKEGDRFLVYINEQFIYWYEVPEFYSRVVESFKSREVTHNIEILSLTK